MIINNINVIIINVAIDIVKSSRGNQGILRNYHN